MADETNEQPEEQPEEKPEEQPEEQPEEKPEEQPEDKKKRMMKKVEKAFREISKINSFTNLPEDVLESAKNKRTLSISQYIDEHYFKDLWVAPEPNEFRMLLGTTHTFNSPQKNPEYDKKDAVSIILEIAKAEGDKRVIETPPGIIGKIINRLATTHSRKTQKQRKADAKLERDLIMLEIEQSLEGEDAVDKEDEDIVDKEAGDEPDTK